jgi:hypothetical protein
MKVEHSQGVKAMTDEQLEAAIEAVKAMLEQRAGEVGTAETIHCRRLTLSWTDRTRVMEAADTAVGARKRKPRKVPSPAGT